MSAEPLALLGWGGLFVLLVTLAIVIGRVSARFFLRATSVRSDRR